MASQQQGTSDISSAIIASNEGPPVEPVDGEEIVEEDEGQQGQTEDEGAALEITFFADVDKVHQLLAEMESKTTKTFSTTNEEPEVCSIFLRFEAILDTYLEAAHVVRPHLASIVPPLTESLQRRLPSFEYIDEVTTTLDESKPEGSPTVMNKEGEEYYREYDADSPKTALHLFSRAIYCLAKVAGIANVMSHFPHAVANLEHAFYCLVLWQRRDELHREWEVRYCMLLWLSNLILAPFALATLDSSVGGDVALSRRILQCAQGFLGDPSRCREGAALFLGRLMTRPDADRLREEFFTFAAKAIAAAATQQLTAGGTLLALATTLKLGKREEMVDMAFELIPLVSSVALNFKDALLCKIAVKTIQRLGLVCLAPSSASTAWRYQRTVMNLETNLHQSSDEKVTGSREHQEGGAKEEEEGDEGDASGTPSEGVVIPEVIESVLDVLLQALSHPDTIVRWSAAKGVGRLLDRLDKTGAEEVIQFLFGVFAVKEDDAGWHGGCLALAELAKRGVLLPEQFPQVVDIIRKALQYDLCRGSYSVGSHVRDAACYMCWSMSRAYNTADLRPFMEEIGTSLIIAALFDREVNVRRASAAAFQECVGRLGSTPHGIELVTTMDFFSLSTLRRSFLEVAPAVGQFECYRLPLIRHLSQVKLYHWDRAVRTAAAESLGLLVPTLSTSPSLSDDSALHSVVFDQLFPSLKKTALGERSTIPMRHGAIGAMARIIERFPATMPVSEGEDPSPLAMPNPDLLRIANSGVWDLIPVLHGKRWFRGRGGEWVRQVCCLLLQALGTRAVPLPEGAVVNITTIRGTKTVNAAEFFLEFYEECWRQPLGWLQEAAVASVRIFTRAYETAFLPTATNLYRKLTESISEKKPPNERRGAVLALGVLPFRILEAAATATAKKSGSEEEDPNPQSARANFLRNKVMGTVVRCTELESMEEAQDAETRSNACRSLVELFLTIAAGEGEHQQEGEGARLHTNELFCFVTDALHKALSDYAIDKRGDVGSYVRLEAMKGYRQLVRWLTVTDNSAAVVTLLTAPSVAQFLRNMIKDLLKQAVEKIDRMRGQAGSILVDALACLSAREKETRIEYPPLDEGDHPLTVIALAERWRSATPVVDWSAPGETFPVLCPLLSVPCFRRALLEGLIHSVGGKSAHVVKASLPSLMVQFEQVELRRALSEELVSLCTAVGSEPDHKEKDRIVGPLYTTLHKLLVNSALDPEVCPALLSEHCLLAELKYFAKDVQRLLGFIPFISSCSLLPSANIRTPSWSICLHLIASRYPKVRATIATELYTSVSLAHESPAEGSGEPPRWEEILDVLSTTQWDGTDAAAIRSKRDTLTAALAVPKVTLPVSAPSAPAKATGIGSKVDGTYKSLVREAGY